MRRQAGAGKPEAMMKVLKWGRGKGQGGRRGPQQRILSEPRGAAGGSVLAPDAKGKQAEAWRH